VVKVVVVGDKWRYAEEPLDDASDLQKRRPKIPPKPETNTLISKSNERKQRWWMNDDDDNGGCVLLMMEMKDGEERGKGKTRDKRRKEAVRPAGAWILL